jgi:hypothetical protein
MISAVVPTTEELAAAKAKREAMDAKKLASTKASLRHFIAQNPDAAAGGLGTDACVDKWLTWLARCSDASKNMENARTVGTNKLKHAELHWYGKELLKKEIGDIRGQTWIDSELLPTRPCRITKQHGEFLTEYGVPDDWEVVTESDLRAMKAQVEFELKDEDGALELAAFMQEADGSSSSSLGEGEVKIKHEASATEIMAEKVDSVRANLEQNLAKMRAVNLETRMMREKAVISQRESGKEQHAVFVSECSKNISDSTKAVTCLEKLFVKGSLPKEEEFPKLVKLIEQVNDAYDSCVDWGGRFKFTSEGVGKVASAKRRRNK